MGSRDLKKGTEAAGRLMDAGLNVQALALDVTQEASVRATEALIRSKHGRLDALVNNAGVYLKQKENSALRVPESDLKETFETNLFGVYRMCQVFAPLLIETAKLPDGAPRIVNLSSGMGQLSEMNGSYPAYRISKTAVNAITRIFSEELAPFKVWVNSVCPGWVKTDMGGAEAPLTPEQGADTIVWAATLPADGPTGGFFRERERIEW